MLVTGEASAIEPTVRLAEATALVRDLVNTPAIDLGPAELEQAVREQLPGFEVKVTAGDELAKGYPLIAAVGAAAPPRARAAADRGRMGQARRPAHRHRRQGRVLRFAAGSTSRAPAACG